MPPLPPPEFNLVPLSPIRKAVAERVTASFRDVPQFDVQAEIDATALVSLRASLKEKGGDVVPGYNDMLIYALSRVLEKHQRLNAHFTSEGIKEFKEINVSFAVAAPDCVLLPVIRRTNQKSLKEIARESQEMTEQAKAMKLRASLQQHGTFTLSSLGGFGIDAFNAIISPPQVAILASGAILKKPRVKDGAVLAVDSMVLTLTVDHRAVDGAVAAAFLRDLKNYLEQVSFPS